MVRARNQLWLLRAAIYGYWQSPNMVSGIQLGGTILVGEFMTVTIFFELLIINMPSMKILVPADFSSVGNICSQNVVGITDCFLFIRSEQKPYVFL